MLPPRSKLPITRLCGQYSCERPLFCGALSLVGGTNQPHASNPTATHASVVGSLNPQGH